MLIENRIIDGKIVEYDKVKVAIQRLQSFEPSDGYWLAFSGGKDSCVIKELANMAGVKYEAHYSLTTVDPPELVWFIKDKHPDVTIDHPELTMWQLIVKKGTPPLRMSRYCCSELKESRGENRVVITGVRWAESVRRKANREMVEIGKAGGIIYNDDNDEARKSVEQCYRTQKTIINPIIDWLDVDVWEFIRKFDIAYCSLYDEGRKRIGCIGCPMNSKVHLDFERWPTYKRAYIRAFDNMIKHRMETGKKTILWKTGQECFDWWVHWNENNGTVTMDGQIEIE
jgi:phosphoadenosine phosphosulfate reductase